jgi:hypothetical protein
MERFAIGGGGVVRTVSSAVLPLDPGCTGPGPAGPGMRPAGGSVPNTRVVFVEWRGQNGRLRNDSQWL